jgi:hypothetical protein
MTYFPVFRIHHEIESILQRFIIRLNRPDQRAWARGSMVGRWQYDGWVGLLEETQNGSVALRGI